MALRMEPGTRDDFLKYSSKITLDSNTASNYVVLSEGNRKATKTGSCQNYAEHPNRFAWWSMALSNEILTTPCYWEVERHGKVHIGVAYDTIGRTRADENSLGYGPKSWALFCTPSGYEFLHNGQKTSVSGPQSSRVGLFLDPSAGILSFYSVTHTMTLLHRVQTTFIEPLRAALWFYWDKGDNAEICNQGETSAVSGGPGVCEVTGVGDSTSREDFLRYSHEITLDPNTASNYVVLSEGNRKATKTGSCQNYAEHPNRFAWWCMALSNEILTTPCYWEVERHGKVHIGVAYDTIGRTRADENSLGYGPKSWALFCTPSGYQFLHNGQKTSVSGPQSSRVGLFLDPSAGILSFYSVTHTMTLLHRVQTTFTEPLRAALWFYWDNGDNAEICNQGETLAVSGGPGVSEVTGVAGVTEVGDSTSREDFLRYSCEITLDPNTASNNVVLSEGNRKATKTGKCQYYAKHPNRFAWWSMALSKEILTTPCYWEVEQHGKVHIGVAYSTIGRTRADENSLGYGPKSWALFCTPSGYEFLHNGQKTSVSGPQSSRVGLFLDPNAGILSFYSVTHTMTLLHRVQTTFIEPLRAALWFYWDNGDNAEICNQGETSAVSGGPGVCEVTGVAGVTGVGESTSREDFLRYSHEITLDPNTASNYVVLSDGNRKATKTGTCQNYAEHPNRFAWWSMALSNEILTTPCYWEVERHGKVHIGVAYDTIGRTRADENSLGYGPKSWALFCTPSGYEFLHNGQKNSVSGPQSSRVGLFLDPSAGILSFYSVSHTMTLLHRVQTTFTEPLCAALWFYWDNGDNAEICNQGETSAVSGGPGVAGVTGVGDSRSREDFLRYSHEITLDPNTASNYVVLSEGNRRATKTGSCQNYAEHPNRFTWWSMALSNEILTTPCYWEVERHGKVHIGVAYDTIGRTRADENSLGYGPKSWALFCTPSGYQFLHNGQKTSVSGPQSSRVGLFLDPNAGILSFYSVTHTMTLLHKVQTTFTEPLRAALWFYWDNGDNAEICNQGETLAVSGGPGVCEVTGVAGVTEVGDSTSREDFLRYSREITLDPNTASNYVVLSEGNRKATKTGSCQNYAEHPNRFTWWSMALSNEILTTPCYWEVERHGKVHIGVAYDTIGRARADENSLGYGPKSWALFCTPSGYEFLHNGQKTSVSGPQSSRVGLFLDPNAGILSFYSVTHTMTLLHRVQTTFTEPLRAALWFYWDNGDNAEICNQSETSAVSGGPGVCEVTGVAGVTGVGDSTSREDFLRYSCDITLDPNTASNYVVLSEGNRKATKTGKFQYYDKHPNRFTWWSMALSNEILTTPCYWEVERHGKVHIGVAYDTIGRTRANENSLGYGPKSWALFCTPSGYEFLHNGQKTSVSGPQSSRVGLFLDSNAGILSFYSVSHTMTLLHRVQTTFTEPLRAALWFYWDKGDNAEIWNPGETSTVSGGPGVAGVTGVGDSTSREDFLRYSCEITLDPNTASNYVVLSEGNRKATKTGKCQYYAKHPNRFAWWSMALSNEILTTPCYWEVERHGKVHIGVAYDTIGRTGANENSLGYGPKSWALFCTPSGYEFLHNGQKNSVSGPQSSRVGLFLDPNAGILSFYSVSHTMTLLHRVQTTFTEPLRAALWFYWDKGDNAEIWNQSETLAVSGGPGVCEVTGVAGVTEVGDSTSREDFLRYSREITLDPNTASNYVVLSEGNRKATKTGSCQNYAEHPNRFAWWSMALSNEILTTPCYWEVERHGKVHIGVAYDTIGRTRADENSLGYGPKSWALFCTPSGYEFLHNGQKTSVSGPQSSRVGLFLDPNAGVLSFYSVTHTMTLLHRVQTTFTEPLCAALWFYWNNGDNAEICNQGETSAVSGGPGVAGVTGVGDSRSREDFLRYSHEITLDPNTASNYVVLSEGNRKATKTGSCQNYAEHPNRFTWWSMALSNEILTTPCYWEVERHGKVHIGVAYDTIGRTRADENSLGYGPKSWALFCTPSGYQFLHNGQKTNVSGPQSSRVGLFLDPNAGILSFYSVTHTMTLLHKVQTTFTEPLRAALWFYWDNGDNAEICNQGETSAVSWGPGVCEVTGVAGVTGVGESTSREDFLGYSREITLDPNTASNYVVLSEGNRKATKTGSCQYYAKHPNRFAWWCMALSNEILTTPCYWEVERHGKVHIGVAYDTIGRTGADKNSLGYGPKSWALFCTPSGYQFLHNGQKNSVSGPQSSRVGLFLDPSAGILSFYSVTHTMTLLHRVQTTFTEPLRAALWFYWDNGDNAEICKV